MKWLRENYKINKEELRLLDEELTNFYLNPPQIYHEEASEANEDWNASDHVFHRRITNLAFTEAKVLDIGCGPAMSCPFFLEKGADYTGIDLSKKQIEENKTTYPQCDFFYMHWRDIPKLGEIFDIVTSFFVLEHIVYPQEYLRASAGCVKKNGLLAVLCPDFLERGFLPSQHFFGRKAGGMKAKIKKLEWIEALIEIFDRYLIYPTVIQKARSKAKKDGAWLINLKPVCLEVKSWKRDWDAVYMVSEDEVVNYIKSLGFKIVERGKTFRNSNNPEIYPDFCYVLAQKIA